MKIVHSFWSKPIYEKKETQQLVGGWTHKTYHYMSWALSCLKFKEFYSQIELVTDKLGYEILCDKMQLPYSSVKIELDRLNHYHSSLWAIGKIYTYSIQTEPFLHVDNDVYIWGALGKDVENSGLVAQHLESGYGSNLEFVEDIMQKFKYIPQEILKEHEETKKVIQPNAGIFGGSDIDFFKRYTKKAFEFVDGNLQKIRYLKDMGCFNVIFEQYLFYCYAKEQNKLQDIYYLLDTDENGGIEVGNFLELPHSKYIHTFGHLKRQVEIVNNMAERLLKEYPTYYYRILDLVNNNSI